ncbi:MAG TPA: succinate dehydrogenase [Burkholderiaceae bacterium]|nr:succinate dehydrogenase [Burkholderiaceae bacterium]
MKTSVAAVRARRWYWQHVSAMVLAVCVAVHIVIIVYAMHGGLTGAEILARTHDNWTFGIFYAVFVIACAVHVPAGVANVLEEWVGLRVATSDVISKLFGLLILVLGLQAVYAVILS